MWCHGNWSVVYGLELRSPRRWQKCKQTAENNTFYPNRCHHPLITQLNENIKTEFGSPLWRGFEKWSPKTMLNSIPRTSLAEQQAKNMYTISSSFCNMNTNPENLLHDQSDIKCTRIIWFTEIRWKADGKGFFQIKINGILLPKLFWPTVRKNCSSDREKLLKFLRSLEQFIQTVKGQNNFW